MRLALLVALLLFGKLALCQDLTGIWRGSFSSSDKMLNLLEVDDRYKFEVQIDQQQKKIQGIATNIINGVTYSYKSTVFYGKATANGTVNPKTGKVLLQELKIVEVKMRQSSYACIMTCFLQYTKNGDEEFLEGKYSSYGEKDSSFCGRGTVFLRKVTTSDFYKEPFLVNKEKKKEPRKSVSPAPENKDKPSIAAVPKTKPPVTGTPDKSKSATPPVVKKSTDHPPAREPVIKAKPETPGPRPSDAGAIPGLAKNDTIKRDFPSVKRESVNVPKVLATRENELIRTITVNSNEVQINIYDNGTIDHDTVSVYLDKKLVVSKQMLTTSPIIVKFKMDESNDTHELIMVADNLGDIPPNTSLMVVKAGDKEYEVRIASTEQKNAVVIFKYEKPK